MTITTTIMYVNRLRNSILLSVVALLLQSCSTTSVFNPYPNQAAQYRAAITNGTVDDLTTQLLSLEKRQDGLLYAQEAGRLYQVNNQFEASKQAFDSVYQKYQAIDDRSHISASKTAASATSLLTNDNAIPYQGYGFERIFALYFQALNYLALNDIDGAAVEFRRLDAMQRRLELAHEKEVRKVEKKASQESITLDSWKNAPELIGVNQLSANVKSSFQNAYAFYASALFWEALGDTNNALVDYKKALALNPNSATILRDIARVDQGVTVGKEQGHIVLFLEDGFVMPRQSFDLSLPYINSNDNMTFFSIAFPYYQQSSPASAFSLTWQNQSFNAELLADIDAMAAKALIENIPMMILRMVLRAKAKYELQKQSEKQAGVLGSLIATIYNLASEQADRRNWLTLPAKVQFLRIDLPYGEQTLELDVQGVKRTIKVSAQAGRVTMVRVINANRRLLVQQFQL